MPATDGRVVVVGAGITGLSVARELGPDYDVLVFDRGGIAADTTSRASGMISLALEPIPDEWIAFALDAFHDLDGRGIFSFTDRETVRLVPDAGDTTAGGREAGHPQGGAPRGGTYLARPELRDRYPGSFADLSGYRGGVVYDRTGYLDALDYAMTLKHLAEEAGAGIFRDHEVTGVRVEGGAVTGVETAHGPVAADHVVYATGWKTRELLAEHVELPVRPLRWNAVVVEPDSSLPEGFPLGSEPAHRVYWRPTARGDVLVGGNEYLLSDPEGTPMGVDTSFRDRVLESIAPRLAGVGGGTVRREDCCPTADCASPDGLPIVDAPAAAPDGLVVAAGLHGRGIMLSPVVGRTVRSIVAGEPAPFPTGGLALARFDDRSADFEYRSHWDGPDG